LNVVVVGMPWRMTLCQISSFLRPVAAGMVALMASSITERWFLRTEEAGVLSLVSRRTWWLVVNSIVAISGFLIALLIASRMVRVLVVSGRGVPFLSMTMVRSRLVRTEEVESLFCWLVGGLPGVLWQLFGPRSVVVEVAGGGGVVPAWWFGTGV